MERTGGVYPIKGRMPGNRFLRSPACIMKKLFLLVVHLILLVYEIPMKKPCKTNEGFLKEK